MIWQFEYFTLRRNPRSRNNGLTADFYCYNYASEKSMMTKTDWKQLTKEELFLAEQSRDDGNEGRARVCARRAAGHVAGEYLLRRGIALETKSALQKIRYLETSAEISPTERETLEHFLIHTTTEHRLPFDADLIADVHLLARLLLGESLD
jgi:hypothetical protein